MSKSHPIFEQALRPFAPPMTEADAIAADLENNRNKAARAHRAQEQNAMRLQLKYQPWEQS